MYSEDTNEPFNNLKERPNSYYSLTSHQVTKLMIYGNCTFSEAIMTQIGIAGVVTDREGKNTFLNLSELNNKNCTDNVNDPPTLLKDNST